MRGLPTVGRSKKDEGKEGKGLSEQGLDSLVFGAFSLAA
jgi:hypothetical protein